MEPKTAVVDVKSVWSSKIFWTQVVGIVAVLATNFLDWEISAETQVGIVSALAVGGDLLTGLFRARFTNTVTPASLG